MEAFADPDSHVRQSVNRVRMSPFPVCADNVRGFVRDVATGLLREVPAHSDEANLQPNGTGSAS